MLNFIPRSNKKKVGAQPGTLVHIGEQKNEQVSINYIGYNEDGLVRETLEDPGAIESYMDENSINWINVNGLHDVAKLEAIGQYFNLHYLLMEDILNTTHRPKVEEHPDYLFIVIKMLYRSEEDNAYVQSEQVSMVIGKHVVLTFQETEGDVFNKVRERIIGGKGIIRKMGASYLAYALIDAIVDNYFVVMEKVGGTLEHIEDELLDDPNEAVLKEIHQVKRELISLRRAIWPIREVVSTLQRGDFPIIEKKVLTYLRDVYDHTIQVVDALESYRDLSSSLQDVYLSVVSNRMNEVMKILTIIATIFIPLTFLAGVYGMNFKYMPELGWKYSYYVVLGIMIVAAVLMLFYFKRKKWL